MKKTCVIAAILILLICPDSRSLGAETADNNIFAGLLKKHVVRGRVDYDGFKKDEPLLDDYLSMLSTVDPDLLPKMHQFAYFINVYNAATIKLVLTRYPGIDSIKDIGGIFSSPWDQKFIRLKKGVFSLDDIEHKILRPVYKDPRVHFAANCASKSCPPLRNEPYDGERLDQQLDEQARKFVNDGRNNFFRDGTLFLSRIFKWYEDDFDGKPVQFVRQYASGNLKQKIDDSKDRLDISYLNYDWSLNKP